MTKLKKIGVLFSAKLQAIQMTFVGLIAGILYAGLGAIYDAFTGALGLGTALACFAIIGMPFIFALFGFLGGAIGAVFYNMVARRFGGIKMEFEQ